MNKRALSSITMLLALGLLAASGLPLHLAILRTDHNASHILMAVHNSAALLLLAAAGYHLWVNRQAIFRQAIDRTRRLLPFRREAAVALAIVFGFTLLVSSHAFHVHP